MQESSPLLRSLAGLAAGAFLFQTAIAATYLWDVASPGANNWNVNANWSPNTGNPGAADTATFGAVGTGSDALTVNNVVSVNTTASVLNFTNTTAANWHVTQIPAGVTLTVTNLKVGYSAATGASSASGANTAAAMFDGGNLIGLGGLSIGHGPTATPVGVATLDLSGLSNFVFNAGSGTFQVAVINRNAGNLKFAAVSNHLTAATVNLNTASTSSTTRERSRWAQAPIFSTSAQLTSQLAGPLPPLLFRPAAAAGFASAAPAERTPVSPT